VIEYERTSWWRTCLAFHGTVLPAVLGRVGLLTGFSLLLYLLNEYALKPSGRPLPQMDQLGHTVLGVALGLLIVFRTNSANNRYWEARSHWGALVNASRNLVRYAAAHAGGAEELARLVTAYVLALKEGLRGSRDLKALLPLVPGRLVDRLGGAGNPAALLSRSLSEWVARRKAEGRLDPIHAGRMEGLIGQMVDAQGGCEKIRRTPLPFVYAALIKQVLLLYLASLPFVLVRMDFVAPLVVAGVSLGMLGIEEAGVEVESPFGLDPNHLPLEALCAAISRDAADLAADPAAPGR
jgi:putative membrane protein